MPRTRIPFDLTRKVPTRKQEAIAEGEFFPFGYLSFSLLSWFHGGVPLAAMLVPIEIQCPHCGETISTTADTSQGDYTTIEDCEVCCAPMNIEVLCEPGHVNDVRVSLA